MQGAAPSCLGGPAALPAALTHCTRVPGAATLPGSFKDTQRVRLNESGQGLGLGEEGLCLYLWKLLCPKKSSRLDSAWRCDLGKISKHFQPLSPSAKWLETSTFQGGYDTQTRGC